MLKLLCNDYHKIDNDTMMVSLTENKNETYLFDLNEIKETNIIVELSSFVQVTLLNVDSLKGKHIVFNLSKGACLNFNLAYFEVADQSRVEVNMKENSSFNGAFADFSKEKNDFCFVCNLLERNAQAHWHLATLAKKEDRKIFDISFFHYAKNTYAKMENYGVCEGSSSLSFLGTSKIFNNAKQSETHQSAKIMVFDQKCNAKASPILCIDENDVKASHAAVVGQINEEHIFYLTSRGIDEKTAKNLITLGYLMPILSYFEEKEINKIIKKKIEERV